MCIACSTAEDYSNCQRLILSHYLGDMNSAMEYGKMPLGTNGMLGMEHRSLWTDGKKCANIKENKIW